MSHSQLPGNSPPLLRLALVWRHFTLHPLRAALSVLGVALGVAVAVAVQLANGTALDAFSQTARAVAGPAAWQVVTPGGDLNEDVLPRLAPLLQWAELSPVLEVPAVTAEAAPRPLRLIGVDLLAPGAFRGYATPPSDAATPPEAPRDGWPRGIWLTADASQRLGVTLGGSLPLLVQDRAVDLAVAGVLPAGRETAALDPWVAFMDVAALQELADRVGRLDRVDLVARPGVKPESLRAAAKELNVPGVELLEPAEATRTAERMLASFRMNLTALSFVALVVGAYLIYNAISISVVQRRREIAMLRALGALRRQIFSIFALEALLVGLLGGGLGLLLGSLLARGAVAAVGQTVDALYVDTSVNQVAWSPTPYATGLAAGLILSLVAAWAPAHEATTTPSALAMRAGTWESGQRRRTGYWTLWGGGLLLLALGFASIPAGGGPPWGGYAAAALVVLGVSFWAPVTVRAWSQVADEVARTFPRWLTLQLAARNFRRAVGRNAVAVAALMVGAAMTIGVATMVGSFRSTVAAWVDTTLPGAFYVNPPASGTTSGLGAIATLDPSVADTFEALPGVVAVERFRERPLPYRGLVIRLGAPDMQVRARYGRMVLRDPGNAKALMQACIGADKVLVSEALSIKHGVDVGSPLTLETPSGPKSFQVTAVYHDYASDQGYVLMDRGTYQRYWLDTSMTHLAVHAAPDAPRESLRLALQRALGDRRAVILSSQELRAQVMRVFDDTFAITYALHAVAMTVSLLGVAGTLAALVLERGRELAILRQIGLLRRQVAAMVMTEAALIGLAGASLGLLGGWFLAELLIRVINRESFGWSVQFQWPFGFIAATFAAVVLAAVVAGYLPARAAARAKLVEAMRDE
ncbi:MAG: FtsX-like permease family protein [Candidatus Sericytochromatia bacterium]|nr:FtsX-like permease family protein [Candidatus Sericytochromatia bacterium]